MGRYDNDEERYFSKRNRNNSNKSGYKSDHSFRTDLWNAVTNGLPSQQRGDAKRWLEKYHQETKNQMLFDELLGVVKVVMVDDGRFNWDDKRKKWFKINDD